MRVLALVLAALTLLSQPVLAVERERRADDIGTQPNTKNVARISVAEQGDGMLVLDVDYPWQSYTKTSVEVWLLPNDRPEDVQPTPLRIVHHALKGETSVKVGQCLKAGFEAGKVDHCTFNDTPLDIVGHRNSMGKPAVCFAAKALKYLDPPHQVEEDEKMQKAQPRFGSWAGFCELENWSSNRHRLQLDLSKDYFSKPGKLYIWFFRDETVLWETSMDWRGYP